MITLEKSVILGAIRKVLPGVEKGKTTIDGADQLLFTGTHVYSHNGLVAVAAPCDTQGQTFSVKGMNFFNWVSKINDLMLAMEIKDGKIILKGGRNKTSMKLMDPSSIQSYVDALDVASLEFTPLPEGFQDTVTICMLEGNSTALKGIAVGPADDPEGGKQDSPDDDLSRPSAVYSTDSDRICQQALSGSMKRFWVDDRILLDAFKVGAPVGYCIKGFWLHLYYADSSTFSAQVKDCVAYPFRTCREFIGSIPASSVVVSGRLPKDIGDAVSRVSILAGSGTDSGMTGLVRLTFRQEELELHAERDDGDATETVPWDEALDKDPGVSIYVSIRFLTGAANKTMDFSLVEAQDGSRSLVFRSGDYIQMVSTSSN